MTPRLLPGQSRLRSLAAVALLALAPAARAVPRLDLQAYPPPAAGERRWVIQLPGLLRPLDADPRSWRVQLVVGRMMRVDCNIHQLTGVLEANSLPRSGATLYRLAPASGSAPAGMVISTRMACPGRPLQERLVSLAGEPLLVPYNASMPVVVDLPQDLELRWRVWKPAEALQLAQPL